MSYIASMQLVRQTILASCVFAAAMTAVAEQRSMDVYTSIVERNPFGLKDPPVPVPAATNKPPAEQKKEDFYLTGISTMGDPRRPKVYLLNKDLTKKEYDQKFYTLSVGDKQGDVAVKEIDPKGRRVLIAYQGEDRWLSMKDNSVPAPAGPAMGPGGMPLVPGGPGVVPPPPGAVPTPLPGGAAPVVQPQPLNYPNAGNANRRMPRSSYNTSASMMPVSTPPGVPTVTPIGNQEAGPQTDEDVLKQMARMKSPNKLGNLPANIPPPPTPF
jgi:hypothetical protein